MSQPSTTRTPPEILFVPPLDRPVTRPHIIVLLVIIASVMGAIVLAALFGSGGGGAPSPVILLLAPSAMIVVGLWLRRQNKTQATARHQFLQKHPVDESDPHVVALAAAWKRPDQPPKLEDVQAALAETPHDSHPGARIINFGEPDVPDVGEMHFEPEIITPTGAIWRQFRWLWIAAILLGLWLADYLGWLPAKLPSIRQYMGGFTYLFAMAVGVFVTWIWRSAIRPTYIRMAPGIIQVLEYRYWKAKPSIRSYPMQPGTLAVFAHALKHRVLTLIHHTDKDVLRFSRMRNPEQCAERAWQAMLSTAPTPPLSDEDLVG